MTDWEKVVAEEQEEKLDISADMIRQYKTMQSTMALRIHLLESNLSHLQVVRVGFWDNRLILLIPPVIELVPIYCSSDLYFPNL